MNPPRYLALGDSYTIGEGADASDRWPAQLGRALRAAGTPVAEPKVVARTGWTTDELAAGISAASVAGDYALVSLLIGVNDHYRGATSADYRGRFRKLLDASIGLAGGRAAGVIVLSIPDWGVTPFAEGRDRRRIGLEIDEFNTAAAEETARAGAKWVNVTATSRESHRDWLVADGLHPSAAQYAVWTALALAPAAAALRAT